MAYGGEVRTNFNRAALGDINDTVLESITEIFEADIKGDAQELSPVDTGTNRRSIATDVQQLGAEKGGGVLAELYTQSGYGGYLELGHRVRGDSGEMVEGTPYLYPAFIKNIPMLFPTLQHNFTIKVARL